MRRVNKICELIQNKFIFNNPVETIKSKYKYTHLFHIFYNKNYIFSNCEIHYSEFLFISLNLVTLNESVNDTVDIIISYKVTLIL